MKNALLVLLRGVLLLVGASMMLGGGICVAMDVALMFNTDPYASFKLLLFLIVICLLVAWAGWKLVKYSGVGRYFSKDVQGK